MSLGSLIDNLFGVIFGPRSLQDLTPLLIIAQTINGDTPQAVQNISEAILTKDDTRIPSWVHIMLPLKQNNTQRTTDQNNSPGPQNESTTTKLEKEWMKTLKNASCTLLT